MKAAQETEQKSTLSHMGASLAEIELMEIIIRLEIAKEQISKHRLDRIDGKDFSETYIGKNMSKVAESIDDIIEEVKTEIRLLTKRREEKKDFLKLISEKIPQVCINSKMGIYESHGRYNSYVPEIK